MIKLHPLPKQGTIGIMAPSSPVDEERLQNGVCYFEKKGYRVITTPSCYARDNYLAGSAESRAAELVGLADNPDVDIIFFARGGFGCTAMLPLLDFNRIAASRKLLIGYSDITALQWGLYAKTGLPSLSTGMPATDFDTDPIHPDFESNFWNFMETGRIDYNLNVPANKKKGSSLGIAMPGTLSVATKLIGTSYLPDLQNTIPILEDVGESRHKIEGYLLQAKLSGWFDRCEAVVFGNFTKPEQETFPDNPSLEKIIRRIFNDISLPVVTSVPYGHIKHKIPIPLGVEISLSYGSTVRFSSTDTLFDF